MATRQRPLMLEELGARVLLSATPLPSTVPLAATALHATQQPPLHVLSGQGEGTFSAQTTHPDVGAEYRFSGEGYFAGLGQVDIRGTVNAAGFLAHGHATGTLTLTNELVSVTLTLAGPDQPGFSNLAERFSYRAVGRTGAGHLSNQGTLFLRLASEPAGDMDGPDGAFVLTVALQGQPGVALDGAFAGQFTPNLVFPEAGASYSLTGTGRLPGQGAVGLTGWVQGTGMIASGHATGELTISGAQGSMTLDLLGPTQRGFAPLPGQFRFTVRSGTGIYAHCRSSGTITLHLDSGDSTFTLAVLAA